jgi:hypothetical protein
LEGPVPPTGLVGDGTSGVNDGPDGGCGGGVTVNFDAGADAAAGAGNAFELLEGAGVGFDQLNVGNEFEAPGDCEDGPPARTDVGRARLGEEVDGGWLGMVTPWLSANETCFVLGSVDDAAADPDTGNVADGADEPGTPKDGSGFEGAAEPETPKDGVGFEGAAAPEASKDGVGFGGADEPGTPKDGNGFEVAAEKGTWKDGNELPSAAEPGALKRGEGGTECEDSALGAVVGVAGAPAPGTPKDGEAWKGLAAVGGTKEVVFGLKPKDDRLNGLFEG